MIRSNRGPGQGKEGQRDVLFAAIIAEPGFSAEVVLQGKVRSQISYFEWHIVLLKYESFWVIKP